MVMMILVMKMNIDVTQSIFKLGPLDYLIEDDDDDDDDDDNDDYSCNSVNFQVRTSRF